MTKIILVAKFSQENKQKNTQFWPEIFHFSKQDHLFFARIEIRVTEFPKKNRKKNWAGEFFQRSKFWMRIRVKCGFFLAVEKHFFLKRGGIITLKLASPSLQHLGAYTSMPQHYPLFGAKDVYYDVIPLQYVGELIPDPVRNSAVQSEAFGGWDI